MAYLRKLNERNQITIPPKVLRDAGLPAGGLYSIEAEKGRIILECKQIADEDLDEKTLDALEALVRKQIKKKQFTEYPNPRAAKEHFKRLRE